MARINYAVVDIDDNTLAVRVSRGQAEACLAYHRSEGKRCCLRRETCSRGECTEETLIGFDQPAPATV